MALLLRFKFIRQRLESTLSLALPDSEQESGVALCWAKPMSIVKYVSLLGVVVQYSDVSGMTAQIFPDILQDFAQGFLPERVGQEIYGAFTKIGF